MTTRRRFIRAIAATSLAGAWGGRGIEAAPAMEIAPASNEPKSSVSIDDLVGTWMDAHQVPALSLAFARPGELLMARAWGVVEWGGAAAAPGNLFRIASVTKPITSVTIFSLIERGFLQLDAQVFGAGALLDGEFGADLPDDLNRITVRHLLNHTAGGWPNDARDPTLRHAELEPRPWLEWVVRRRPLPYAPGEKYLYSNVGFCLLGRIIEKLTAQSYADFVRETVLLPCGIQAMRLAAREPAPGEVRYTDQTGADPYARNMARLQACAGWLATPTDLVRFATRLPQLLQRETMKIMTTPSALNPNYACGWSVNARGTMWHSGGIAGSNALLVRLSSGLSWALIVNTNGPRTLEALNELGWQIANSVPQWRGELNSTASQS